MNDPLTLWRMVCACCLFFGGVGGDLLHPDFSLPGFPWSSCSCINVFHFLAVWLSFKIRVGLDIEFYQSWQSTKNSDFSWVWHIPLSHCPSLTGPSSPMTPLCELETLSPWSQPRHQALQLHKESRRSAGPLNPWGAVPAVLHLTPP